MQNKSRYFVFSLVLLAVLFASFSVLSGRLLQGMRVDLSENNLYTLSEGTRNILDELQEQGATDNRHEQGPAVITRQKQYFQNAVIIPGALRKKDRAGGASDQSADRAPPMRFNHNAE